MQSIDSLFALAHFLLDERAIPKDEYVYEARRLRRLVAAYETVTLMHSAYTMKQLACIFVELRDYCRHIQHTYRIRSDILTQDTRGDTYQKVKKL